MSQNRKVMLLAHTVLHLMMDKCQIALHCVMTQIFQLAELSQVRGVMRLVSRLQQRQRRMRLLWRRGVDTLSFRPNDTDGCCSRQSGKIGIKTRFFAETVVMEKRFLLACERGDMGSVRHYLQVRFCCRVIHVYNICSLQVVAPANAEFNINCVDPLNRSALLIAIENENIEMIEALLDAGVGNAFTYIMYADNSGRNRRRHPIRN